MQQVLAPQQPARAARSNHTEYRKQQQQKACVRRMPIASEQRKTELTGNMLGVWVISGRASLFGVGLSIGHWPVINQLHVIKNHTQLRTPPSPVVRAHDTFTCTLTPHTPHAARDYTVRFKCISLLCVCPRVDPDMPCSHDVTSSLLSATISASSKAYKLTDHRTRLRVAL